MSENKYTPKFLAEMRALPLWRKIQITQARIIEWYQHFDGKVYVSFSGGKDSTVLLHIARQVFPEIPAVFSDTGLEYPEIKAFVKTHEHTEIIRPSMSFVEVITAYGYPIISKEVAEAIHYARGRLSSANKSRERETDATTTWKRQMLLGTRTNKIPGQTRQPREMLSGGSRAGVAKKSQFNKEKWLPLCQQAPFKISHYCCTIMKKAPMGKYQRSHKEKPILATMTEESRLRRQAWLKHGCNAFGANKQTSQPMSFWTEQDVLNYVRLYHLNIAPVYGTIITCDADNNPVLPLGDVGYFTKSGAWVDGMNGCKHHCSLCQRTGCIFCGFGAHLDKTPTRFQLLKDFQPQLYDYCLRGGRWIDNPDHDPSDDGKPDEMGWINWNPKQIWIPGNGGLGMKYVFDFCNSIYGKDFIRYE